MTQPILWIVQVDRFAISEPFHIRFGKSRVGYGKKFHLAQTDGHVGKRVVEVGRIAGRWELFTSRTRLLALAVRVLCALLRQSCRLTLGLKFFTILTLDR